MPAPTSLADAAVLLDCRWLGPGGPGRVTKVVLAELADARPPGRWLLWGDVPAEYTWPGAEAAPARHPPGTWWGQRGLFGVPRHDCAVYLHQVRPLRPGRAVTLIHDTIPLRFGAGPSRLLKRRFLTAVARRSTVILTVSEWSKATIARDLGVTPAGVRVAQPAVDMELVRAIRRERSTAVAREELLFVGRFQPHKNLGRLLEAFGVSEFARRGGALRLVGGDPDQVRQLRRKVERMKLRSVEVQPSCTEPELVGLYAAAKLLVVPSLEEGFGLPAREAALAGVPVLASNGGALVEFRAGVVPNFDPYSVPAMASAIDESARRVDRGVTTPKIAQSDGPGLAAAIIAAVEQALSVEGP